MKFLTLIFTFYILLLPCVPCTDTDECIHIYTTAIASNSSDHNNHQHENEACNPYCTCCGQIYYSYIQQNKVETIKPSEKTKRQFFYINISLTSNFFGNIWQPPKFS